MAEEVAAGYVSLYARMEGSQVASEISSVLEGAASSAASAFTGFGSIVSGIGKDLTIMSVGADALLTKAGKGMLDTISVGENAAITFNTMGKAMGEAEGFADSFIAKLNDFAVRTPFEFTNILPAVKQLMAMGYTANEILDDNNKGILTSAGNAAAALGLTDQGLSNILLQFGHIKSMGKAMSFQLNAMARNGLPVWDMLADHLKMTKEEVRELVRAGKLDADTTIAALMEGMEKYEGMMEAMSHSLSGILSNMRDALHKPILEMYNSESYKRLEDSMYNLVEPLTNLMTALQPTLDVIFDQMAKGVDVVREKVQQLTGWMNGQNPHVLADIFKNAVVALNSGPLLLLLGKGSNAIGNMFAGFGASVTREMGIARNGMRLATDGIASFRESFTLLKEPLKSTREGLTGLYRGVEMLANMRLSYFTDDLRRIRDNMLGIRSSSTALVKAVDFTMPERQMSNLSRASKYLSTEFGKFGRYAAEVGRASMPALTFATKSFLKVFATVGEKLLGASAAIGVVSAAAVSLMAVFNSLGVNVADFVAKALVGFEQFVDSLPAKMTAIGDMFRGLLESGQLEALFVQLTQRLPELLSNAINSVFSGLQTPAIGEAFKKMVVIIADTIATNGPIILDGLLKAIGLAAQGLADAIPIVAEHIPEFVRGMADKIVENAPLLLDGFKRAFQNISTGVGDAMDEILKDTGDEKLGKLGDQFKEFGQKLSDLAELASKIDWTPFVRLGAAISGLVLAIGGFVADTITGFVEGLASQDFSGLTSLADGVSSLADGLAKIIPGSDASNGGEELGRILGLLANETFKGIGDTLKGIGDAIKYIFETLNAIGSFIGGNPRPLYNLMGEIGGMADAFEKISKAVPLVGPVIDLLERLGVIDLSSIRPQLDAVGDGVKQLKTDELDAAESSKYLDDGLSNLKEQFNNSKSSAEEMSGAISNIDFGSAAKKASGMADGMQGSMRRAINSTNGFGGQVSSNINAASPSMGRIVSDAGVMATGIGTNSAAAGNNAYRLVPGVQNASAQGTAAFDGFVSSVGSGTNQVGTFAGEIPGKFDPVRNISLVDAGAAIMNGFLSGLKSAWGAVKDFILSIAPWIHGSKGPLDYDRRLLIPAGQAIMEGLYKGLKMGFTNDVMPLVLSVADTIDEAFDSMAMPTPSMAGVSLGNMAAGDVRGPVVMQPTIIVNDVDNPEAFARESVTYMNQLIESEGRNG